MFELAISIGENKLIEGINFTLYAALLFYYCTLKHIVNKLIKVKSLTIVTKGLSHNEKIYTIHAALLRWHVFNLSEDYTQAQLINHYLYFTLWLNQESSVVYEGFFDSHFGKKWGTSGGSWVESILRNVTGGNLVISVISCFMRKLYWM